MASAHYGEGRLMEIRRDEIFHLIRWINLIIGLGCVYIYALGGGHYMLGMGAINLAIWAFTRKYNGKA